MGRCWCHRRLLEWSIWIRDNGLDSWGKSKCLRVSYEMWGSFEVIDSTLLLLVIVLFLGLCFSLQLMTFCKGQESFKLTSGKLQQYVGTGSRGHLCFFKFWSYKNTQMGEGTTVSPTPMQPTYGLLFNKCLLDEWINKSNEEPGVRQLVM